MKRLNLLRRILVVSPLLLLNPDALALECNLVASTSQVWDTGFRAEYLVTNNKSQAIHGWSVQLNGLNGTIQTHWDSVVSSTSPNTFNNTGRNSTLQPGASIKFGFLGAKTGDFTFPGCVDTLLANMTIPRLVDPTPLETVQSGGFSWQSITGAVRYDIEQFRLDEAGQPMELLSVASTVDSNWGFSDSSIGHFGWRVRQCDAENNCSAFSDFKRVIKFSLEANRLNRVTGI